MMGIDETQYYLEKASALGCKRNEELMRFLAEVEDGVAFMGKLTITGFVILL